MKTVHLKSNLLRASLLFALLLGAALLLTAPAMATPQDDELAASEETAEAFDEKVTLYMTTWCGWCRKTTTLLNELGVPFRSVDIETDAEGNAEFRRLGNGQGGIPLVDIDGTLIRGYKEAEIRRLIGELEASGKEGDES
ncbi:MAG: glutaredoxin family protein [Acidobacteriota bacterium]